MPLIPCRYAQIGHCQQCTDQWQVIAMLECKLKPDHVARQYVPEKEKQETECEQGAARSQSPRHDQQPGEEQQSGQGGRRLP